MGFFMDGLDAEAFDRKYSDLQLVRRIVGYFRPQFRRMLLVAAAVVLTSLSQTYLPVYISKSLDQLQKNGVATNLTTIALVITLLACASWAFNGIRGWQSSKAVGDVVLKIRYDAFDAVLKRDLSFYDEVSSGKIVSRVTSDTQSTTVYRPVDDLFVQRQCPPGPDDPGAGAIHHACGSGLPPDRPHDYHPITTHQRRSQFPYPGDRQRDQRGEDFPAGSSHL
jgi:hypothetical protein